ncbi:hypothetical protein [Rossellomorea sp. KS-H15a]|jgi:hypothetical protein|uniref:hypothetical protein n=1 Tax=Rossellomorea sp. KS-H15a TaxID=2963940 RepID=UPI0020C63590|nr:hypothetical protein [Rossellomorea sp. KS-H15a]UTE78539.1 hypothetical protein M1J35_07195 [Rossellomorea sp. KS-H15a]
MNYYKNKRYWILMPPFLLTTLGLFFILPEDKWGYPFVVVIAFWITYYAWNDYTLKKSEETDESTEKRIN